jgi:GTP-binding protein HflX
LPNEKEETIQDDLEELAGLLTTLGIATVGRVMQKKPKILAGSFFGIGKIDEIKQLAAAYQAQVLVVDRPISGPQQRALEEATGCHVLDRSAIILEIFAQHAKTNTAKTQVEIAKLEYLLPRLSGAWTHLGRQTGGGITRGMGEKQIEIDRRRARERIHKLQKKLEEFEKHYRTQSKARQGEIKIALVGYTNSGKTTIMKGMAKGDFTPQDALFATLDATTRNLDPSTKPKILISDTVGFIRNLPHALIASFKSTLSQLKDADLLLHVVDASSPHFKDHMKTTEDVLLELELSHIPRMLVFNKCDLCEDHFLPKILTKAYGNAICINAYTEADLLRLRNQIYRFFDGHFATNTVAIPAGDRDLMSFIYEHFKILDLNYDEDNQAIMKIRGSTEHFAQISRYKIPDERVAIQ